jgi:hypothetical protein
MFTFGSATFQGTTDLKISGTPYSTKLTCTATVFDANPDLAKPNLSDNPSVNPSANPNKQANYPPMGKLTFEIDDGTTITTMSPACPPLTLIDSSTLNPKQAPGQAPFMSSCPSGQINISSSKTAPREPAITVKYGGEGGATPGHAAANDFRIHVNFDFN